MKNKYIEVEVLPSVLAENENQFFVARDFRKKYKVKKTTLGIKKFWLYFFRTGLVSLLLLFPLFSSGQTTFKQEIINLTNQERLEHNLSPLSINSFLDEAAYKKGKDMLDDNYFSHTSPQGKKPWDFILETNYDFYQAGENLAINFSNPQNVVKAWMGSETHKENILEPNYEDIGLAVLKGEFQGNETILIVQMFGEEE